MLRDSRCIVSQPRYLATNSVSLSAVTFAPPFHAEKPRFHWNFEVLECQRAANVNNIVLMKHCQTKSLEKQSFHSSVAKEFNGVGLSD